MSIYNTVIEEMLMFVASTEAGSQYESLGASGSQRQPVWSCTCQQSNCTSLRLQRYQQKSKIIMQYTFIHSLII